MRNILEGETAPLNEARGLPKFADWRQVTLEIDYFDHPTGTETFFNRLHLLDARQRVAKMDAAIYISLRELPSTSPIIQTVIKAVLGVFVGLEESLNLNSWRVCKGYLSAQLTKLVVSWDPTTQSRARRTLDAYAVIHKLTYDNVANTKCVPAIQFYNWLRAAAALANDSV
jgi:hypothetical protein